MTAHQSPVVTEVGDRLLVQWPSGRAPVVMSPEAFELIVERINDLVDRAEQAEAALMQYRPSS